MNNTTSTNKPTTAPNNRTSLLVLIPNMVTGDTHTNTVVDQAFQQVGQIQMVANGIYYLETTQSVTSWADQVKQSLGVDMKFFLVPINDQFLNMYRAYLPQVIQSRISSQIQAA